MSSSPARFSFALNGLAATEALAGTLAPLLRAGDVVMLEGGLGAGKTTFSRLLIEALAGEAVTVPSPTFTLVQPYTLPRFTLYHFDLYRLKNADELVELGIEEALLSGVTLMEWPALAVDFLPPDCLKLEFTFTDADERRLVTMDAPGKWQAWARRVSLS